VSHTDFLPRPFLLTQNKPMSHIQFLNHSTYRGKTLSCLLLIDRTLHLRHVTFLLTSLHFFTLLYYIYIFQLTHFPSQNNTHNIISNQQKQKLHYYQVLTNHTVFSTRITTNFSSTIDFSLEHVYYESIFGVT
jgi:hypothetical protein